MQEIAELRPLPSVALRVLEIAESEHFSAHELAQAIGTDAALTAKMPRLANSAYYGFPRRISTVRDAVVLLGFRAVRSATLATCVIDTMPRGAQIDDRTFWHFSITVGMLAEVLARSTRRHADEAFTAGVLHNIGRLALDQQRPDALRRAMATFRNDGRIHEFADRCVRLGATCLFDAPFCPGLKHLVDHSTGPEDAHCTAFGVEAHVDIR